MACISYRRHSPKRGNDGARPPCWKLNAKRWVQLITAIFVLMTTVVGFAKAIGFTSMMLN